MVYIGKYRVYNYTIECSHPKRREIWLRCFFTTIWHSKPLILRRCLDHASTTLAPSDLKGIGLVHHHTQFNLLSATTLTWKNRKRHSSIDYGIPYTKLPIIIITQPQQHSKIVIVNSQYYWRRRERDDDDDWWLMMIYSSAEAITFLAEHHPTPHMETR